MKTITKASILLLYAIGGLAVAIILTVMTIDALNEPIYCDNVPCMEIVK